MNYYALDEIALTDEYLTAIGRLMVNWNQLDAVFDLLLIKLMGCRMWDVRSHMVIVGMNFGNKVELVKSLATLQAPPDDAHFTKLVTETLPRISALQGKRNGVAHYKWLVSEEGVSGLRMAAKGKLKITETPVSIEELKKDSADMIVMLNEIFRLLPADEVSQ